MSSSSSSSNTGGEASDNASAPPPPYGGSSSNSTGTGPLHSPNWGRRKVTVQKILDTYRSGTPITVLTAYDYPTAIHVDRAGVDICLVGDSLAMVSCGYDSTNKLSLDEMLYHCRSVARGAKYAFRVADLPYGTYEGRTSALGMETAKRLIQEGHMDGVKIEGGLEVTRHISAMTSFGIPVMGHIGLLPQRAPAWSGYKAQGSTVGAAQALLKAAQSHERSGAFMLVLEAIPSRLGKYITQRLNIPTIGIGAGPDTSGQVLVQLDMLGGAEGRMPRFVKQYASIHKTSVNAISEYVKDVRARRFPSFDHTYRMPDAAWEQFLARIEGNQGAAERAVADARAEEEREDGDVLVGSGNGTEVEMEEKDLDLMLEQVKADLNNRKRSRAEDEVDRISQGFGDKRQAIAKMLEKAAKDNKEGEQGVGSTVMRDQEYRHSEDTEIPSSSSAAAPSSSSSPFSTLSGTRSFSSVSRPTMSRRSPSRGFHTTALRQQVNTEDPPGWYNILGEYSDPKSPSQALQPRTLNHPKSVKYVFRGRSVRVMENRGVQKAVGRLNNRIRLNNVKRELRLGQRYEKPTDMRRRVRSERHRRRFKELVRRKVQLAMQMKARGL